MIYICILDKTDKIIHTKKKKKHTGQGQTKIHKITKQGKLK